MLGATPTHTRCENGENKRKPPVHRFWFTSDPPDEVALTAADFLYNIHSCLNHLAAAIVPSDNRSSINFPILWQGVWEPSIEGEDEQRLKDRQKWTTFTRDMDEGAVAIIKANQPRDLARNEPSTDALAVINRLRNKDAHTKLPVVGVGLRNPTGTLRLPDGTIQGFKARNFGDMIGLHDGAPLEDLPDGAMDVQLTGTPVVVVNIGLPDGGVLVPDSFRDVAFNGTKRMIELLRPYDRL